MQKIVLTFAAAALAAAASAYTVYDAGKALRQNSASGAYAGANGMIAGTFAAADANGGVFNGLTLVGALPTYVPTGTLMIFR